MANLPDKPIDPNAPIHPVVATYALVGTIATAWSTLERGIDTALWMMSGVPNGDLGACLTAQIQSVRAKLIALEALAYLHGATEEAAKAIRNFRNETEGPSRRRNNIIHNPIYGSGEDAELKLGLLTLDKKLVKTDEKLDPNQLAAFLNEIGVLIGKFSVLMNTHVLPLRPASAGKPQMPPIQTPLFPLREVKIHKRGSSRLDHLGCDLNFL